VTLGGCVDALVFAGGIGEKGAKLRYAVAKGVECLGFTVDEEVNQQQVSETVVDIGGANSRHKILVCQTDEQFEMASECMSKILQVDDIGNK